MTRFEENLCATVVFYFSNLSFLYDIFSRVSSRYVSLLLRLLYTSPKMHSYYISKTKTSVQQST